MPKSRISAAVYELFKEAGSNVLEERMVDHIIRELRAGKELSDILQDEYVAARLDQKHTMHVLGNKELLKAFEERIRKDIEAMNVER